MSSNWQPSFVTSDENWEGVLGLQLTDTNFSAVGEEAFIPETAVENMALFFVESIPLEAFVFEVGARIERASLDPGHCATSETVVSLSASAMRNMLEASTLRFGVSRNERAPTVEERYSNISATTCQVVADPVNHAATDQIEIGNPGLEPETSVNIEAGLDHMFGNLQVKLSAFYSDIDQYIFLSQTDVDAVQFVAEDATFSGAEFSLEGPVYEHNNWLLNGRVQADVVRAKVDVSGNLPRIPPARIGFGLGWQSGPWSADVDVTRVFRQDRVAPLELPTGGFTRVTLHADYHLYL